MERTILILGGGFAGLRAAQCLSEKHLPNTRIQLLDPKNCFEYHAVLYRFALGGSAQECCIPYTALLRGTTVEHIKEAAAKLDLQNRAVVGESGHAYRYDRLILALGKESSSMGVPGVEEHAFGVKSASEAARLRMHLKQEISKKNNTALSIAIIGGGPTGVELAGSVLDECPQCSVTLLERGSTILPSLSAEESAIATKRLHQIGVTLRTSVVVSEVRKNAVILKDDVISADLIVWTAGSKPHRLVREATDLSMDERGRVLVNENLQAQGYDNVFVLGDMAATLWSGMAQTALQDGVNVAEVIANKERKGGSHQKNFVIRKPLYAVPIGRKWALCRIGPIIFRARIGWMLRRILDCIVFRTLLRSTKAALRLMKEGPGM
jgi:NADH:ubiquinone reductase (H+-translocating)